MFEAFGRRYGKDKSLGIFGTKQQAESKLKNFMQQSLGASGRVTKNNVALGFGELSSFKGREWLPSKRDAKRIVQARKFRLGTRAEKVEIFQARKKKKKKSINLDWFE
jgi:hypothetical protein